MGAIEISKVDINAVGSTEAFVLDTNVLYFIHHAFYMTGGQNQIKNVIYSDFVSKLLSRGNRLYVSAGNLQELMHLLEKKAYELYLSVNGYSPDYRKSNYFSIKEYRRSPTERAAVKNQLNVAFHQVISSYGVFDCPILHDDIKAMINDYDKHRYDPMDYVTVTTCKRKRLLNFISDDSDFRHDSSINVYYA
jgi:predicted nucleic acid-binding protein